MIAIYNLLSESFYLKLVTTCKNLFLLLVVVRLVIFFLNLEPVAIILNNFKQFPTFQKKYNNSLLFDNICSCDPYWIIVLFALATSRILRVYWIFFCNSPAVSLEFPCVDDSISFLKHDPPRGSTTGVLLELLPGCTRIHHVDPPGSAIGIPQDPPLGSTKINNWDHPGTTKWIHQ